MCLKIGGCLRICNPSTREFITLLDTKTETPSAPSFSYYGMDRFGFDPINNEHKALHTCVIKTGDPENEMLMEHWVFTLGAYSWRRIGDGPPHFPTDIGVCVDGTIYCKGWTSMANPQGNEAVVAFDVRLETFRCIRFPAGVSLMKEDSALIRYDKLFALVDYQRLKDGNSMELRVLKELHKEVWAKKSIVLPYTWWDIIEDRDFYLAGAIRTGEIILAPCSLKRPFYLVYVDTKRSSVREVEIHGLPDYDLRFGQPFCNISATDHVESILSLSDLNY